MYRFFNTEFQIITNRVHNKNIEYPDFVKRLINPDTKVLDKLANINVALFAGFESSHLKNYDKKNFEKNIIEEIKKLEMRVQEGLSQHPWNEHLNFFLFLFPLDDKRAFVSTLHQKLKGAQQI